MINIQFLNANPALLGNLEFRRALLHAMDRSELNETINHGLGGVADAWLQPITSDLPLRWPTGSSGTPMTPGVLRKSSRDWGIVAGRRVSYRDEAGQPIHIEFRSYGAGHHQPAGARPDRGWLERAGDIDVEPGSARASWSRDRRPGRSFPRSRCWPPGRACRPTGCGSGTARRCRCRRPSSLGSNRGRYQHPELDADHRALRRNHPEGRSGWPCWGTSSTTRRNRSRSSPRSSSLRRVWLGRHGSRAQRAITSGTCTIASPATPELLGP